MRNLAFTSAYESVMGYAPDDVKQILQREIPRIEANIERELDKFSRELADYIQIEVRREVELAVAAAREDERRMQKGFDALRSAAATDPVLRGAVEQLAGYVEQYEARWRGVGETLKRAAITAARAAGVPLPSA